MEGLNVISMNQDFAFVKVNENNIQSWPSKCNPLRHSTQVGQFESKINRDYDIQVGDLVLVHKRPKYLYVSLAMTSHKELD
jgi:aspartyl-tRNA synthetase